MNIDRLRKIIEYSEKNRTQMDSKVAKFYSFTGISEDKDMLDRKSTRLNSSHRT